MAGRFSGSRGYVKIKIEQIIEQLLTKTQNPED
jgi:hypothetical protein